MDNHSPAKKFGYLWVTGILFASSFAGHWVLSWQAYVSEARTHGETPETGEYLTQTMRDTLENWQSEFLQLLWQVAGLAFLWSVGSPQSKEGDDRKEEKIDALLRKLHGKEGEKIIAALDRKYPKR